jgi:membrane protein YqaA with SNARE-associated domain
MTNNRRITLLRVIAFLAVIAISVVIYLLRDQAEALARYGYAGIFLLSILANATIILPAPGIAIVFAMGGVFNPILVAISAGLGSALGELSGYIAGFSGQAVVQETQAYQSIRSWMENNKKLAFLVIFVLAALPNPFFDIAGIAAGTLKMPVWEFLIWCGLGKTVKMLFFAYAGFVSLDLFNL